MGKYKNILLDLDGTILDSGSGIMKSIQYVLDHFSMYHEPEEKLRKFIGPALIDSFMNFYGFSKEKAEEAVEYFRDYYPEKGMFDAFIYPGMRECIEKMAGDGKKQILQHFGLSDYFFMEIGPDLSEQSSDKTRLIEKALREGNFLKEDCLMVGDTKYDILAAKDVGIDSVAALYGYGEVEEISIAKYSIEKPLDLLSIV